ncbi:MAG: hypothetical protein K6E64_04385 [Lachnospiraceae bacterium]|nr:hypothetical protein [Lachnospiraceae bacterium]
MSEYLCFSSQAYFQNVFKEKFKITPKEYRRNHTTDKTTRVGVLPYGYADGFLRSLSNKCSLITKEGPAKLQSKNIIFA